MAEEWIIPKEAPPWVIQYINPQTKYKGPHTMIRRFHPPMPPRLLPKAASMPEDREFRSYLEQEASRLRMAPYDKVDKGPPTLTPYQKLYLWISHYLLGDKWA